MSTLLDQPCRPMTADGAAAPIVEVAGLVKDYRGLRPLRLAALRVDAGELVCLSGFDAVAAEVLVNLLNGAIVPDLGEVRVFGRPTSSIADETEWFAFLERLGIVTTRAVLLDGLTITQNLALPLTLDIDPVSPEHGARVRALAEEAGIAAGSLERPAGDASAELRVRVHLARALAVDPEVLLLEHPTVGLDRAGATALARTVRDVSASRGLTVVAVSEDAAFTAAADRALRVQPSTGALVAATGWRRFFAHG
jgi:ABC-type transporter Mla maintaining outer membrane lipid asymmetry ATPase subunit MlaF